MSFFLIVFINNTRCLMSQMTLTKNNLKNLGSESRSDGTFGTGLGGLLHGLGFTLGVTRYASESCGGEGGSLAVP